MYWIRRASILVFCFRDDSLALLEVLCLETLSLELCILLTVFFYSCNTFVTSFTIHPQLQLIAFAVAILLLATSGQDLFLFAQICNCVTTTSTTFCFDFTFSSSSLRCLVCIQPRLSLTLLLIFTAFALSTFFLSFSTVSSAAASFRLFHPEPFALHWNHIQSHLPALRVSTLL